MKPYSYGNKHSIALFIFCFTERKRNGADNFSQYTTVRYPLQLGVVDDLQDHPAPEAWPWVHLLGRQETL